jgi:hypothetical protein
MKNAVWTEADTDAMFANIGRYLIIFQWVEGVLDQILLLGWGQENWEAGQAKLAKMKNYEKVNAVDELVLNSVDFSRVHTRPQWCSNFKLLIARLHGERERRNSLVHSQYLFEFADLGLSPLRSSRRKVDGSVQFDQEYLTKVIQEKLLSNLTLLAMDIGFTHTQLIHDYKAPASI